jgi:hypothetical protein
VASEDYFVPEDLDALRRENELLALENTYLKGRIAGLELELERARKAGQGPAPAPPPAPAAAVEGGLDEDDADP